MNIPELNINVTKAAINGQVYDVISREEYAKNPEKYDNGSFALRSLKNENIILPIRNKYNENSNVPGVYLLDNIGAIDVTPDEKFEARYIPDKFITLDNLDTIQDLITKGDAIKKLDEPFLTSPDNITYIPIKDTDQPEMKGLKMALNAKNIDLDKYAGRFGENFPNDKRQLKNSNATLKIIKRFCENCDMEAIITFKDKSTNVPNPMNTEISVSLTELTDEEDYTSESEDDSDD